MKKGACDGGAVKAILPVEQINGKETEQGVSDRTHTRPFDAEHALECPEATKYRLGLDDFSSWIITSELNHFNWPGFDVKPTPDNRPSYGLLPNQLTRRIIESIKRAAHDFRVVARN